ncbi:MAG: anti-sigma factor family protein [Noviherbaspirillum sp.]
MNMRITDEQLCAYLDGELDANEHALVRRAVLQDAALEARLAGWTSQTAHLRDAMRAELDEPLPEAWLQLARKPASVPAAPAPVRPSLSERLMRRPPLRWLPAPRFAAGMAVAVLVGIFVGRDLMPRLDMDGQLVRLASVAHHVYSPDKRQPVEVKSEDPTLVTWISKRLGAKVFAPSVSGFRFMGGRLLAGAEEPAGQFMYENAAGKRLTVFVRTEGAAGRSTQPACDAYRGVSVCYWYAGGVAYALAGEVPQAELAALAAPAAVSARP